MENTAARNRSFLNESQNDIVQNIVNQTEFVVTTKELNDNQKVAILAQKIKEMAYDMGDLQKDLQKMNKNLRSSHSRSRIMSEVSDYEEEVADE